MSRHLHDAETQALLRSHRGVQPSGLWDSLTVVSDCSSCSGDEEAKVSPPLQRPGLPRLVHPLSEEVCRSMPLWAIIPRRMMEDGAKTCTRAMGIASTPTALSFMCDVLCALYACRPLQQAFADFRTVEEARDGVENEEEDDLGLLHMVEVTKACLASRKHVTSTLCGFDVAMAAEPAVLFLWRCWVLARRPHWWSAT